MSTNKDYEAAICDVKALDRELLGRVLQLTSLETFEIYGDASRERLSNLGVGGVDPAVYALFAGLAEAGEHSNEGAWASC